MPVLRLRQLLFLLGVLLWLLPTEQKMPHTSELVQVSLAQRVAAATNVTNNARRITGTSGGAPPRALPHASQTASQLPPAVSW